MVATWKSCIARTEQRECQSPDSAAIFDRKGLFPVIYAAESPFSSRYLFVATPDSAWLLLRSLKTLRPRVERQTATAAELAERLRRHPAVERVRYPGFGGMLSFDVRGDAPRVERSLKTITNATSLGGVDSVLESRSRWEGDRVPENLLRLSVGLEDVDELWADLEQALSNA